MPNTVRRKTAFDGYVKRLQQSSNTVERDSIYWGYNLHHEYPIVTPVELLFEHVHIMGAPGTGKTALGLAPLIVQLVRRNDGPVIVIDLKGDMALFNTVRHEAHVSDRVFKWFTNKPYHSTYGFNPWRQSYLERLTLPEILGMTLLSLNLHHGDDYGRAFFGMKMRAFLQDALEEALTLENDGRNRSASKVPQSFVELNQLLRDLSRSSDEYKQAEHLLHVLQSLLDFPQLNMTPGTSPASEHAIHMPEVVREKQVVYFYLQSLMDVTSAAEIARLAMYSALSAAVAYRDETGSKPRVYFIVDEAHIMVAQNIANVMAQAREYQMGCVFAHQTLGQLNPPGGVDLRELFLSCTSIKQFWSARDPHVKDYISKISGEVGYYSASWDQFKRRVSRGEIGRQYAASHPNEDKYIRVSESVGPRLTSQDIEDYSRQSNTCILAIERNVGLSCFQGAFPVHMDWIVDKDDFIDRNLKIGWPSESVETVSTIGVWPSLNRPSWTQPPVASDVVIEHSEEPTASQTRVSNQTSSNADQMLAEMERRLSNKKKGKR